MPVKSYYWRNPQKHRLEVNLRRRRLRILGVSAAGQYSLAAQIKRRTYQNNYVKTHRKILTLNQKRYSHKLRRLFGVESKFTRWLYHMLKEEQNAKKRKALLKTLCD